MDRKEFLRRLFAMYPATFTTGENGNGKIWREAYETVLKSDWDYDKLFYKFVKSYQHTHIAPAPAFFVEFIKDVEPQKVSENENILQIIKESAEEPTENFINAKQKLLENSSKNSSKFTVYGGKYD